MNDSIFRKESMESLKSPEQLTDYIKVTRPSVWILFAAVILLLGGIVVWGIFGKMDTYIDVCAISDSNIVVCYVRSEESSNVKVGTPVKIKGEEYPIISVVQEPIKVDGSFDDYAKYVGGFSQGEWVFAAIVDADLPEGVYQAKLVSERLKPISFIFN